MEWHFQANGQIREHQSVGKHPDFVSRPKLYKLLRERYNSDPTKYNLIEEITLPFSKARAKIVYNDAEAVMQSLLTDPRIRDDDYGFFNDDPFAPPPEDLDYIGDLNTGLSYLKTYQKLIKDPTKEILLPIPFYCDGAVTGQFVGLPVTAVQFTLGIFTREARDKEHLWRTLGYVPGYSSGKSKGKSFFKDSGHADAQMAYQKRRNDEGVDTIDDKDIVKAQDLHAMLEVILRGFLPLQDRGFIWDLQYKGKVYKDVKFIPFVPFWKSDTDEAEKLAGSYTSRTNNVSQLCRYCECPTEQSDRCLANYPLKTKNKIQKLVSRNDTEKLKKLSQHNIQNATYALRMGLHSDQHIHGSCPLEMLHALLLGIFSYVRDMLFEQCGPTSKLAEEIDGIASEYGVRFNRQSDRDMPKTVFNGGVQGGKLMAKEFTGVLLNILATLRSTLGRGLLMDKKRSNFAEDGKLKDWIMLLEILIQWEQWLKSPKMMRSQVERLKKKHRYIMHLIKRVGKRSKGMGLKITKFHMILHMYADIINFGVPLEYDTGSNEAAHKSTKTAAKVTQKKEEFFDEQVATRREEVHLLELAKEEIAGRPPWNYYHGHHHTDPKTPEFGNPTVGGAAFLAYIDEDTGEHCFKMTTRSKDEGNVWLESDLVDFLIGLQEEVSDYLKSVPLYTKHERYGTTFRGSPCYAGEVWRDWVLVNWGKDGKLPNKIYGFVDLRGLPQNARVNFGGMMRISPGLYAIVENAAYIDDEVEENMSELLTPIEKEVGAKEDGMVSKQTFYLADVEAFLEPLVVIPDQGGEPTVYFMLKSRSEWRKLFSEWLEMPHKYDVIDDEEEDD
jgi:hypothetical protein